MMKETAARVARRKDNGGTIFQWREENKAIAFTVFEESDIIAP